MNTANNPDRYSEPVSDLDSAAARIGDKALKNTILSTNFIDNDTDSSDSKRFNTMYRWVWERNLLSVAIRYHHDSNGCEEENEWLSDFTFIIKAGEFFVMSRWLVNLNPPDEKLKYSQINLRQQI